MLTCLFFVFCFVEGTTRFRAGLSCSCSFSFEFFFEFLFEFSFLFWRGEMEEGGIEKMIWSVLDEDTSR